MKSYLEARQSAVAAHWNLTDEVVLVAAGEPIGKPGGADQTYPFLPHTEYFYLADRARPGSVMAFDPREGWVDFVPEISQAERVWEGGGEEEGVPASRMPAWLEARRHRPLAVLGCPIPGVEDDPELRIRVREGLSAVRRHKDAVEVDRLRRAAAATAAGFARLSELLQPGISERELQIELEAAFFRAGAQHTSFDTIIASGANSAVLHFPPTNRKLVAGELVLVDSGADVDGYACDVTRTYPVGGRFTPEQRDLYAVVLAAQEHAVASCRDGVEFKEIHLAAARDIAAGLVDFGLLKGSPEELVETAATALFFPHGLGHLVGLGVRDASGYLPGRERSTHPVLQYLRVDMPLRQGYVITVEPGVYFIPALLNDPELRTRHRDRVRWDRVESLLTFGGIRIEDDVLVTAGDPEVLTAAIPKSVAGISA